MRKSRFEPKANAREGLRARADGSNRARLGDSEAAFADGDDRSNDAADSSAHYERSSERRGTDDRSKRLEHARALLKQAVEQPKASRVVETQTSKAKADAPSAAPILQSDPFEDADPFEPFEHCAPDDPHSSVQAPTPDEPVYSRTSQRPRKTSVKDAGNAKRPQRTLKGRALGFLSRREYSRAELSRRLRPYVEAADDLESLLDGLERDGWLSNERFVESVVHRRATRMGGARIADELKRHAVGDTLISETASKLAQTETARVQAVWEKKYGTLPETPAERAKQARFLAVRGFSGSTIGKVLKGGDEDFGEEFVDD